MQKDTTISQNTNGVAGVKVVKSNMKSTQKSSHAGDILFNFVMEGSMSLEGEGREPFDLTSGDAFVIPPGLVTQYKNASKDLKLLEVSLPGKFETKIY